MDSKMGPAASNTSNFEPASDLIQEEECDTLLLYLPGFSKEHLRVQLTRSRVMKISGTRPLGNNKLSSFQKDFPVSVNCDVEKITAKFEDGILYVRQPKLIVPAADKDDKKSTPPPQPPQPQKPAEQPPPPPKTDQERQQTTPSDDDRVKDFAEKKEEKPSNEKEEKPSKEEERVREPEVGKKDERKYDKPEGGKKHERNYGAERTGGADDDKNKKAAAARAGGDKRDKIPGTKADERSKLNAAARLKTKREKMTKMLILLFVFALGIYLSRQLPWFSRKVED